MYRTSFTRLFDLDLVGFDGDRRSVSVGSGALLFVAGFLHPFLDFCRRTRQGLLSLQTRIGACAPVPASLRPERVPDFPESKWCAGGGLWRFARIRQAGDWCTFCLCRCAWIYECTLATTCSIPS